MIAHSMLNPIGASLVESLVANHLLDPQPQPQQQPLTAQPSLSDVTVDKEDDNTTSNESTVTMMETEEEEEDVAPIVVVAPTPPPISILFPSCYNHDSLLLAAVAANPPTTKHNSPRMKDNRNYRRPHSQSRQSRYRNCFLIKGPKKSGRTSLLMDLAMSLASKTPCRCNHNNNINHRHGNNNSHNDYADDVAAQQQQQQQEDSDATTFQCHCIAVTIFRPAVAVATTSRTEQERYRYYGDLNENNFNNNNNNNQNDDDHVMNEYYDTEEFPLFCHQIHDPITDISLATSSATTAMEKTTTTTTTTTLSSENALCNSNKDKKTSSRADNDNASSSSNKEQLNEQAQSLLLSRIQVHHVTSARQILSYLLQVQGLTPQEQPWGGILIDDLHLFGRMSSNNGNNNTDNNYNVVLLSQIVALLADTANWIEEKSMQTQMPTSSMIPKMTIAVSLLDNAISSKWTDYFWSSLFLDQIITIVPSTHRSPLDWYKDLVTTTTITAPQQSSNWYMQQQQQQGRDGQYHSSNQNNTVSTMVMNSMNLTPTTPITSWSLQVQRSQQPRRPLLQHDEPHFKQQKRFHDSIMERVAVVEYAIIMQNDHDHHDDDDYKNGHQHADGGGCIVWKDRQWLNISNNKY